MVRLEIEPYIGRPTEVAFEAQGGVHGESALAFHDLIDAPGRDADVFGYAVFREANRLGSGFALKQFKWPT